MSVRLVIAEDTEHLRRMLVDILYAASIDGEIECRAKDAGAASCVARTAGVEALAREITAITFCLER